MKKTLFALCMVMGFYACSPTKQAKVEQTNLPPKQLENVHISIVTDSGTIVLRLYDETPLHRNNFTDLVLKGFYDSLLFHRVIPAFMIQGGDPGSKRAQPGTMLGDGGGDMPRIPAEIQPQLYHKAGALGAARDNNPEKMSSASQFYIVEGRTYTEEELNKIEQRNGRTFTAEQREVYKTKGGTPFLDGNYTVFGEIVSGLEVIKKIANMRRDANDRPITDIRMYAKVNVATLR